MLAWIVIFLEEKQTQSCFKSLERMYAVFNHIFLPTLVYTVVIFSIQEIERGRAQIQCKLWGAQRCLVLKKGNDSWVSVLILSTKFILSCLLLLHNVAFLLTHHCLSSVTQKLLCMFALFSTYRRQSEVTLRSTTSSFLSDKKMNETDLILLC